MNKVLVVEDSKFVANAIKIILEQANLNVVLASVFTKVFELAKQEKPDLIILDLNLPGITGEDIFKQLKKDSKTNKIKILILTAKADAMRWEENLQKADKFMAKPFDNDNLLKTVKSLLKSK